jgi:branched-chain amino acid transport system substrate-binding protein
MESSPHSTASLMMRTAGLAALLLSQAAHADIVVGQVAPFSGPQAITGKAVRAGAQLWFDAVNARGGVKGQQIRFVTRDDAQKPEQTVRLVKELIEKEAPWPCSAPSAPATSRRWRPTACCRAATSA